MHPPKPKPPLARTIAAPGYRPLGAGTLISTREETPEPQIIKDSNGFDAMSALGMLRTIKTYQWLSFDSSIAPPLEIGTIEHHLGEGLCYYYTLAGEQRLVTSISGAVEYGPDTSIWAAAAAQTKVVMAPKHMHWHLVCTHEDGPAIGYLGKNVNSGTLVFRAIGSSKDSSPSYAAWYVCETPFFKCSNPNWRPPVSEPPLPEPAPQPLPLQSTFAPLYQEIIPRDELPAPKPQPKRTVHEPVRAKRKMTHE